MKKFILISTILVSTLSFSQVNIGGQTMSSNAVSLEFGTGNKGFILPYISNISNLTTSVDGTLVFDAAEKKVKLKSNNTWVDLSVDETGSVNTAAQDNKTEKNSARVVIGSNADADNTAGILVLSDTNKAMVLPKVSKPYLNIINPSAGMLVYDTDAKQLAVFNGSVWTFWKP